MELRIFIEPQFGASYEDQLAVAQAAERLGFGAFFRSDHFNNFSAGDGLPGPTDSWITLGAIARETTTIRLGTMVTSVTFRHPGVFAVSIAQIDDMSGGRVDVGLGAGWNDEEHRAHAVPFPSTGERFELLEDQLHILKGFWSTPVGVRFTYEGKQASVIDCAALPKPVQDPPPIIIGGIGPKRTPRLVAQFADEYNTPFLQPDDVAKAQGNIDAACETAGRDPKTILRSAAVTVCCGKDDAEVARRAEAIGQKPEDLRAYGVGGTPQEVVDKLGRYAEVGVTRAYLQVLDLHDLDHLDLIAGEVMGKV